MVASSTTKESIEDRSKADGFTKAFACVQSTWLIIQSIARVAAGLPITQLELATMGFVICSLAMYVLWWDKPFDVDYTTSLKTPGDWDQSIRQSRSWQYEGRVPDLSPDVIMDMIIGARALSPLRAKVLIILTSTGVYAPAIIFSALHVVAWNWDFPSSTVQVLWRTFSVAAIGAFPLLGFLVAFGCTDILDTHGETVLNLVNFSLAIIYLVSRLGLIVLVFYCFSSMPANVYETVNWISYFPHFS